MLRCSALTRSALHLTTALGVVLTVAACSGGDGSPTSDPTAGRELINLDDLRSQGADEVQIASLADGVVTFEEYEAAFGRYSACIKDAGGLVEHPVLVRRDGIQKFDYIVRNPPLPDGVSPADADLSAENECSARHFIGVDVLWGANPDAVAYRERRAAALQKPMHDCLDENGLRMPDTATLSELVRAAAQNADASPKAASCLVTVGYETWEG